MLYGRRLALWIPAAAILAALSAHGQSVISTRSGTVNFSEGVVYLSDQPLESHPGRFSSVPQGGELRTAKGRAEVLLTPGVFLRLGERSAIRMVANQLSDTRVELLSGSAIVDSAEPASGTSVTLLYGNWNVHFLEQGIYRVDSEPARLWVYQGKAEVSAGNKGNALLVSQGMDLPLAQVLVSNRSTDHPHDALSLWSEGRRQSISADNAIAANIQDPASLSISNGASDGFTQFPMLGLPSSGSASVYNSLGTYQPGFSSIYLPGYDYLPGFTLVPILMASGGRFIGTGVGLITPLHPPYGGGGYFIPPRSTVGGPIPYRPASPHPGPVVPVSPHPIPARPAPVGTHAGVRR